MTAATLQSHHRLVGAGPEAANLRARVRSYFSTDQRRKVTQLLREVASIDRQVCSNDLEASVLESA